MPITDTACRQAKAGPKPYKLADGGGLYLLVNQTGKYWRWDYRHAGKRKTLAIGVYPDTTLAMARERHQAARKLLAEGVDPSEQKKADKRAAKVAAANSFESVARAWLAKYQQTVTESTHDHAKSRMEREVFPWLGKRPIAEIDAPEILSVLRRMDERGVRFSAHKTRSEISRVFRHGIIEGVCKSDPARDLDGAARRFYIGKTDTAQTDWPRHPRATRCRKTLRLHYGARLARDVLTQQTPSLDDDAPIQRLNRAVISVLYDSGKCMDLLSRYADGLLQHEPSDAFGTWRRRQRTAKSIKIEICRQ